MEIIVVDDASSDGTAQILMKYPGKIKFLRNQKNSGKGFSVREGIKAATGDLVIVQDADMEYDPNDFEKLIKPILDGKASVVYGSRFTGEHNNLFFTHLLANKFITFLIDILFNTTLSDVEVGYKVFKKTVLDKINLQENRFGFEIEVTAKALKLKEKIFEVPISYTGRDYDEGKKIGMKDGFQALWCIFKYRFF
jgi:glycosyltransferase involved in cell wall biosynthesis